MKMTTVMQVKVCKSWGMKKVVLQKRKILSAIINPLMHGHYYEVLVNGKNFLRIKSLAPGRFRVINLRLSLSLNTKAEEPTGWDTHVKWWQISGQNHRLLFLIRCLKNNII